VQAAVKKLFSREPHKGVNPDEVVAVGAAIQAGDVVLQHFLGPLALGDITVHADVANASALFVVERHGGYVTHPRSAVSAALAYLAPPAAGLSQTLPQLCWVRINEFLAYQFC
jgi:hypothetical protein